MIYIFRHGMTESNLIGNLLSESDEELLPKGVEYFKNISKKLSDLNIDNIYTSPYKRAYQSGSIIANKIGKKLVVVDKLIERKLGDFDGVSKTDVRYKNRIDDLKNINYIPPNGEAPKHAVKRFKSMVDDVLDNKGNSVIISHGGIIYLYMRYVLNQYENTCFLDNGECHIIEKKDNSEIVVTNSKYDFLRN
ncbi:histidine phosphatase family protein [Vibrio gazogenes]|uniref:Probable phosphoglycerate mutase n=1 Tax=Vibrio gazogenes DSM 21264 = NBRC 103151 TaxID=1123492 RepID=A0A1M5CKV3_VIBGA|nr:histidine phosphatase family protein [Vibrio gazogenes]USP14220.1 histidine phosphatase family protein [Vibrio gazogenes]SHF55237.1 probable phosphoglycerate mutase [Vibrio gazogenes DSM 21264] [Vibrio gazogenes DSM 21264 = NBRC 103151]SJN53722.1 Putative phosphoserine phosphatase 2 [Vibrio gazogenes]